MEKLIGTSLGQYRIIEQIGVGGMATVFKAYQAALDRYVAVKVLPAQHALTPGFSERFTREAKAVAQLNHPNILPIYDFGQEGDLSYIVSKYVSAGTLKERMDTPLSLQEAARFIEQLAGALDHAHRRGILHRDVKPSNVLVDEGDWTLLTDFGLAKIIAGESQLTGSGVGIGTPAYMAPEQIIGTEADHRSEIYALGVILYEMLTGRAPYEAETPMAMALKHVQEDPPLPRQLNPDLPEAVERVILKAMAKEPEHRYHSAGEMAQALTQALEASATPATQQKAITPPAAPPAPLPQDTGREATRPGDLSTELQKPVPGLPWTVPVWIVLVLAVIGSLALIRFLLGGWFIFILLVVGVFVVPYWLRPRQVGPDTKVTQRPFGDLRRKGDWRVGHEEIWFFAGKVSLDLTTAQIPPGETRLRLFGFAGNVDVLAPAAVGVSASIAMFATDARILGRRHNQVMAPFHVTSENYETAEQQVRIEIKMFAGDVKVKHA